MDIAQLLDELLEREGGFVNHPADKGGATKYGITIGTLSHWRKQDVTVADVESLTVDEAKIIYSTTYYQEPRINELPPRLQPVVFDIAVNSGRLRAGLILQKALVACGQSCTVDGIIGSGTLKAAREAMANTHEGDALIDTICDLRKAFYVTLCDKKPSQQVFLKGWLARAERFRT